jgi:hypothetical protein
MRHDRLLAFGSVGGAAWSVECSLNGQGLARPTVTAAGETAFTCDSGGEVWLRPSDIGAIAPVPLRRIGACHPTFTSLRDGQLAVTEAGRS